MQRIAVTTENGQIFQHFGKTPAFTLFDTQDGCIVAHRLLPTGDSGHGALGGLLKENGVDVLICGGIGPGAQDVLKEAGIDLVYGITGDVQAAMEAYLGGSLHSNEALLCNHEHHEGGDCHCGHTHA